MRGRTSLSSYNIWDSSTGSGAPCCGTALPPRTAPPSHTSRLAKSRVPATGIRNGRKRAPVPQQGGARHPVPRPAGEARSWPRSGCAGPDTKSAPATGAADHPRGGNHAGQEQGAPARRRSLSRGLRLRRRTALRPRGRRDAAGRKRRSTLRRRRHREPLVADGRKAGTGEAVNRSRPNAVCKCILHFAFRIKYTIFAIRTVRARSSFPSGTPCGTGFAPHGITLNRRQHVAL